MGAMRCRLRKSIADYPLRSMLTQVPLVEKGGAGKGGRFCLHARPKIATRPRAVQHRAVLFCRFLSFKIIAGEVYKH